MWPCSRSSFGLPCCIRGDPFEKPIEVPLSVGAMQVLAMQGEKEGCLVTKLYHTIITRVMIIYTRARKRVCMKEYTIASFKIAMWPQTKWYARKCIIFQPSFLELSFGVILFHSEQKRTKIPRCFCLHFFQARWAKNFDLLRVIAVHGTMTIEFYVEFWVSGQKFSLLGSSLLWFYGKT